MGLEYKTLANKPTFKLKDRFGNEQTCKDLLPVTTFGYRKSTDMPCMVNKYYVARPDLISLAFYGTDEYADIICKINDIANPFELNEDDIINIPDTNDIGLYSNVNNASSDLLPDIEEQDTSILETRSTMQKSFDKKRSPNEQSSGESNYIIDRSLGLIFY